MKRLAALMALALVHGSACADHADKQCVSWVKEILSGSADACSDLCPQAKQFDHYDYLAGLKAAFASE